MASIPIVPPSPSNVIAAGTIWPSLCAFVVALRFYTRRRQGARMLADDWLTIPACILLWGMGATLVYGAASKSLGYPTPKPPNPNDALTFHNFEISTTKQVVWAIELMQTPMLVCVKLSFLFFYRRIFCTGHSKVFSALTISIIAITIVWGVAFFFAILLECNGHFSAWWVDIQDLNTYCGPALTIENAWAISDFITDLMVIILPMPMIWKLHMTTSRKLAVLAPFMLGALAVAASITRMIVFLKAIESLHQSYKASGANDLTTTAGIYWSVMESGLGLFAACIPTIYSLFKAAFDDVKKQRGTKYYSENSKSNPHSGRSKHRNDSTDSGVEIVSGASGPANIEGHAMKDLSTHSSTSDRRNDGIWVKNTFTRTEDMV